MDPVIIPILMGLAFFGLIAFDRSRSKPENQETSSEVSEVPEIPPDPTIYSYFESLDFIEWITIVAGAMTIITGFLRYKKWLLDKKWLRDKIINVVTIVTGFLRYKK